MKALLHRADSPPLPEGLNALLGRCRHGEQEAWRQLVGDWDDTLRSFIEQRLPAAVRHRCDTLDVGQQCWLTVFRKVTTAEQDFPTRQQFRAWLAGIARSTCRHACRDHLRAKNRGIGREQAIPANLPAHDHSPEEVIQAIDTWAIWVGLLSAESRQALLLLVEGYSIQEIADVMGVSQRTTARILCSVRMLLQSSGGGALTLIASLHLRGAGTIPAL